MKLVLFSVLIARLVIPGFTADAKTLRIAGPATILSEDPYASSDVNTAGILINVYEPLVDRDQNLDLRPGLATSWQATTPTTWRFTLRPNVKFSDGRPFTADDVKFSLERANPPQATMYSQFLTSVDRVNVIDPLTVEITTKAPDPLLPRWLASIGIMSKSWAAEHNAIAATTVASGKDQYVTRNSLGTGPFIIQSWDQNSGVITFTKNPNWWGKDGNDITDVVYTPIGSAPTRVAALLAGNVDLVTSLPVQDIARVSASSDFKVVKRPELRQMVLLMGSHQDVPIDTWDKNRVPLKQNPWRDVRVREAVADAINVPQLVDRIMQGNAKQTSTPSMEGMADYQPELDTPRPYDPDRAKQLLAQAGYPDGFRVRLRCTNDRYVNDEAVCRALAAMLARVGIDAQPSPEPWATFAPALLALNQMDFILLAAAPNGQTTYDMLQGTWATKQGPNGQFNWLQWSNKDLDAIVEKLKTEFDPAKRADLIHQAIKITQDQVAGVFLYQQYIDWGMQKNVDVVIRPDNYLVLDAITMT